MATTLSGLPVQLTSFVGRQRELARLQELLDQVRLLTLTGVGGSGKTRLALEVASLASSRFADGVVLIELGSLSDGGQVAGQALVALGARSFPDQPATASLTQHLRNQEVLLLLDNCEHLVGDVAALVASVLRFCPSTRVLATSREPLSIAGEMVFSVPPLGRPHLEERASVEMLGDYEAVQLFVDRARFVNSSFELSRENAASVAAICARLDGIPMAIELAAARVRGLAPEQIAERLSDRFHLLTSGDRLSLPRQQTLRALVDWSYDLLSDKEQALWRRLSTFPLDCTLEGAEAVATFGAIEACEVADLIDQLVSRSILSRNGSGKATRYHMLETLRSYGRDRLEEAGELTTTRARLRAFACELAEAGLDRVLGRRFFTDPTLAIEYPLIRQQAGEAVNERDHRAARLLGASLAGPSQVMGALDDLHRLWSSIVEMDDDGDADLAHLAACLFATERFLATTAERLELVEKVVALLRAGEPNMRTEAMLGLALDECGWQLIWQGDGAAAVPLFEEALRRSPSPSARIERVRNLASVIYVLGETDRALAMIERAEAEARHLDDRFLLASMLLIKARIRLYEGDVTGAEAFLADATEVDATTKARFAELHCFVLLLSDRPREALELVLAAPDASVFAMLPNYAAVVGLAVGDVLPRRAALLFDLRRQALTAMNSPAIGQAVEALDDKLRDELGEAAFEEVAADGAALRGLERIQVLREIATEGLQALTTPRRRGAPGGRANGIPARRLAPGAASPVTGAPRQLGPDPALEALRQMSDLTLFRLCVVGGYRRYDERVRHELRDWSERMTRPLVHDTTAHENFLVWAAPGGGKSFLVQESARSLGDAVTYLELNLAALLREEFQDRLSEARACKAPLLCLFDEIDARGEEAWPYEEAFSLLDLNLEPERRAVFVLVGSHPSGMAAMATHVASRPKGRDLLDRVPMNHRFEVPAPALEDKAVIVASHLCDAGRQRGEPIEEIERLALYYALADPTFTTPRQLRDLAVAAVQNLPSGERRLRYDDLFFRGDDRNYQFRRAHEAAAEELSGHYVALEG